MREQFPLSFTWRAKSSYPAEVILGKSGQKLHVNCEPTFVLKSCQGLTALIKINKNVNEKVAAGVVIVINNFSVTN